MHASTEHFAIDARLLDEFSRADDHGTDGSPETLGETEHDGVAFFRHVHDRLVESDGGVEDAGTVEMDFQARGVGLIADFVDAFGWVDGATGHVGGVFKADESGSGIVINFGANGGSDLFPGENTIFAADGARHAAGDGGHGGEFVEIDVAAFFADDFVAEIGPDFD